MESGIATELDEVVVMEVRGYRNANKNRNRHGEGGSSTIDSVCRKANQLNATELASYGRGTGTEFWEISEERGNIFRMLVLDRHNTTVTNEIEGCVSIRRRFYSIFSRVLIGELSGTPLSAPSLLSVL